jgi:hypothetical protein
VEDEMDMGLDPGSTNGFDEGTCVRVEVESKALGRGVVLLELDKIVECVRPSSPNDIQRITPDELQTGDVLLRMEEGTRSSLFDRIVELAESQPEMRYLSAFRQAWRAAVQRMVSMFSDQRGVDYGRMLRALQEAGATIRSELAVRFWVKEQVIGPEARSSMVAVGHITGSSMLVRQAGDFDRAFRTIRGIRQGIGRRLNTTIRKSFTHFAGGLPEEATSQLDERLGLPLDELLETIDLAEVIEVFPDPERTPIDIAGRFRKMAK